MPTYVWEEDEDVFKYVHSWRTIFIVNNSQYATIITIKSRHWKAKKITQLSNTEEAFGRPIQFV